MNLFKFSARPLLCNCHLHTQTKCTTPPPSALPRWCSKACIAIRISPRTNKSKFQKKNGSRVNIHSYSRLDLHFTSFPIEEWISSQIWGWGLEQVHSKRWLPAASIGTARWETAWKKIQLNPLLFLAKQLFDSNLTVIMFYGSFKLIRAKIIKVFLATSKLKHNKKTHLARNRKTTIFLYSPDNNLFKKII